MRSSRALGAARGPALLVVLALGPGLPACGPSGGGEDEGEPRAPALSASPRPAPDALMEELEQIGYAGQVAEAPGTEFGVSIHDPERSSPGINLIVSAHGPEAMLADMQGSPLHVWRFPLTSVPGLEARSEGNWRRVRVLEGGHLLAIFEHSALVELDRESRLVWSLVDRFHHDLDVLADGTIWALSNQKVVVPEFNETRPIVEDHLVHVSPDGEVLRRVSLVQAFADSDYAPLLFQAAAGGDIFHTNSVKVFDGSLEHLSPLFAAGNALISVWGLDVVAIVDLEAERVVWALTGKWRRQHDPTLLADGNMLVFDNMGARPWARVLELDPFGQEIVWAFRGDEQNGFRSNLLGACQRLPNGNTLITESLRATAFEVTPEGEMVWFYVSPFRFEGDTDGLPVLMEVKRFAPDWQPDWL